MSFSATLRPVEFINQILITIKERLGIEDIEIGNVTADDVEKNVVFDSNSVYDSLNMIAEAFDTEWHIRFTAGKYYIDFGIIEYDKDSPLQLDYGKDRGFVSGLSYNNEDQPTIKRLYVQGGTRNINFDTYIPQVRVSDVYDLKRSNNLGFKFVLSCIKTNFKRFLATFFVSSFSSDFVKKSTTLLYKSANISFIFYCSFFAKRF